MPLPVIPTGTWVELPNTKFSTFATSEGIPTTLPFGGNGRSSIFTAWNSGLFDRNRQRWVTLRAGGHGDWAGNGVYAFSLATLSWSTLRPLYAPCATTYGSPGYIPLGGDSNNLFTPSRLNVYSNDPTDDRTVTITGENVAGTTLNETVQINGTTPTVTTTTWRWIHSIQASGPNITGNVRVVYVRREDETTGIWPTTKSAINSTSSGISRIGGPFNLPSIHHNLVLGGTAAYLQTPTVANLDEPASVHTYDSIEYLASHDVYYSGGGIWHSPGGENFPPTVWIFNPNTNSWSLPQPGSTNRPGSGSSCTVWDPTLNLLWVRTAVGLHTYNYANNEWIQRHTSTAGGTLNSKMIIDTEGRRLYLVFPNNSSTITLYEYNITNPNAVTLVATPVTGTIDIRQGGSSGSIQGLGAVWIGERIAVYGRDTTGLRGAVYTTSPTTPVWQIHEPANGITPPLPESTGGCWNKFCSPDDIHLLRFHTESENVWAYKVPWSTATPFRPTSLTARLK